MGIQYADEVCGVRVIEATTSTFDEYCCVCQFVGKHWERDAQNVIPVHYSGRPEVQIQTLHRLKMADKRISMEWVSNANFNLSGEMPC